MVSGNSDIPTNEPARGANDATDAPAPKPRRGRQAPRSPITSGMRLLDIHDVEDFTRMSEKTIERLLNENDFPKPLWLREEAKRSARRWTLSSIEGWVRRKQNQAEARVA